MDPTLLNGLWGDCSIPGARRPHPQLLSTLSCHRRSLWARVTAFLLSPCPVEWKPPGAQTPSACSSTELHSECRTSPPALQMQADRLVPGCLPGSSEFLAVAFWLGQAATTARSIRLPTRGGGDGLFGKIMNSEAVIRTILGTILRVALPSLATTSHESIFKKKL